MELIKIVNGSTNILGIIGDPIEHTFSPELHNTISRHLGVNAIYLPFHVRSENVSDAVMGLKALNAKGFNITIPHKESISGHLDEISNEAMFIGAVNTVKLKNDRLCGYNTDGEGFKRSLIDEHDTTFNEKRVMVLGAGGAAKAIIYTAAINNAKKITIVNRTVERAGRIAEKLNVQNPNLADYLGIDDLRLYDAIKNSDIIINTTSLGMHPDANKSPLNDDIIFLKDQIICDVIYNPQKTRLLSNAQKQGCRILNGLGMLFFQGVSAYEKWMDLKISSSDVKMLYECFKGIFNKK